ncbi:MAG: hypothetical protein R2712_23810 [Vicinamibacterales bacterium]
MTNVGDCAVRASVWVVVALLAASSPAWARAVGQALPLEIGASGRVVFITMTQANYWDVATTDGA